MSNTEPASGFPSTADVEGDRPSRYAKQLASHMRHKARATETTEGWELFFDPSRAPLRAHDGVQPPVLEIGVWSPPTEGLESVQGAVWENLQKFTTCSGVVAVG